jgi:uncharacterized protein (DUF433 family)
MFFQTPEGSRRVTASRVSLDSIVIAYREGQMPEVIRDAFPTLSPEQIHGALAFYLRNQQEIDRYLDSQELRWETLRQESETANAPLLQRLRASR